MQRNFKFHAVAIGIITVLVIGLYLLIGPSQTGPAGEATPSAGDRQVRIYSATWGMNCNEEIDRLAAEGPSAYQRDEHGNVLPPKRYEKITSDNVLERLRQRCDRRYHCEISADSGSLGVDPIDSCYKDLVVSYRCAPFEPATTLTLSQGDIRTIDCTASAHDATVH